MTEAATEISPLSLNLLSFVQVEGSSSDVVDPVTLPVFHSEEQSPPDLASDDIVSGAPEEPIEAQPDVRKLGGRELSAGARRAEDAIMRDAGEPAAILQGPRDVTALVGDRLLLRASYAGRPEPKVTWNRAVSVFCPMSLGIFPS